jgi:hypothetical protein
MWCREGRWYRQHGVKLRAADLGLRITKRTASRSDQEVEMACCDGDGMKAAMRRRAEMQRGRRKRAGGRADSAEARVERRTAKAAGGRGMCEGNVMWSGVSRVGRRDGRRDGLVSCSFAPPYSSGRGNHLNAARLATHQDQSITEANGLASSVPWRDMHPLLHLYWLWPNLHHQPKSAAIDDFLAGGYSLPALLTLGSQVHHWSFSTPSMTAGT